VVLISFLLFLSRSEASQDKSPGELPYSKVGVINNTPNFQLEVTIDGAGPYVIDRGQAGSLFLKDKGIIGEHQLVAKAYVPATKHFGRRQIGKERTIIFQITGEGKDFPTGKVGWHKIFTYKDFLPHLACFPTQRYTRTKPNGSGILYERRSLTRYQEKWKKDHIDGLIREASQRYHMAEFLLSNKPKIMFEKLLTDINLWMNSKGNQVHSPVVFDDRLWRSRNLFVTNELNLGWRGTMALPFL